MINLLAAQRPTDWNFPLFVHVLGAMVLVGGLLAGATLSTYAPVVSMSAVRFE